MQEQKEMGYDCHIRELELNDYNKGVLNCLEALTTVGNITKEMFETAFNARISKGVYTAVAVDTNSGMIIGTGSMFYEPKFIRECGLKAFIEDVAVSKDAQGRGIGKAIVAFLREKAHMDKCYKIVLSCHESNVGFYEKLKFKKIEDAMALYTSDL